MIFDTLRQGTPAEDGGFLGKNEMAESGIKDMEFNIGDGRKRMKLRRFSSLVPEDSSVIFPDLDVCLKKKRVEDVSENGKLIGSARKRCMSYGSTSMIGRRREMEDAVGVKLGFMSRGEKIYDFFGVYDGHGGWRVAKACSEMMHEVVAETAAVEECCGGVLDWEKVMVAGYGKMDVEVNKKGAEVANTGSTAVVALVGDDELIVANCGDSRAVIFRDGLAVQLSDDHKPDRPDELERIELAGGKVINWNGHRILGVLATSRSIGDQYLKPFVITDPEVKVLNRSAVDEFLILASDGLWDVVSNDIACNVVRRCLNGQLRRNPKVSKSEETSSRDHEVDTKNTRASIAAAILAELAIARGSGDNISVIVVELNRPRNSHYS